MILLTAATLLHAAVDSSIWRAAPDPRSEILEVIHIIFLKIQGLRMGRAALRQLKV